MDMKRELVVMISYADDELQFLLRRGFDGSDSTHATAICEEGASKQGKIRWVCMVWRALSYPVTVKAAGFHSRLCRIWSLLVLYHLPLRVCDVRADSHSGCARPMRSDGPL